MELGRTVTTLNHSTPQSHPGFSRPDSWRTQRVCYRPPRPCFPGPSGREQASPGPRNGTRTLSFPSYLTVPTVPFTLIGEPGAIVKVTVLRMAGLSGGVPLIAYAEGSCCT